MSTLAEGHATAYAEIKRTLDSLTLHQVPAATRRDKAGHERLAAGPAFAEEARIHGESTLAV